VTNPAHTLLCTVGTSLLGHLGLRGQNGPTLPEAAEALTRGGAGAAARVLARLDPLDRRLGAEINSVAELTGRGYIAPDARIELFHSATEEGRTAAGVLAAYFRARGHAVETVEVEHLQDAQPRLFKSKGLRNLAKALCRSVRAWGVDRTAIDATGGYKAQIAVAVLIGQALGLPVYYKHESFNEIISFPPMPVSLDQGLWLRWSGLFAALDRNELVRWEEVEPGWEVEIEPLVERVNIESGTFLDLSPVGQIFHETFRHRFARERDRMLPPAVPAHGKTRPRLTDHDWGNARGPVERLLSRIVEECPYVSRCRDHYWNPDLPAASMFRLRAGKIEGVYSNGTWTVKFWVDTSATTPGQLEACVADLNARFGGWM